MNLESALTSEMIEFAGRVQPRDVCLVPERRAELQRKAVRRSAQLRTCGAGVPGPEERGHRVRCFIDAETAQIDAAQAAGAPVIELHTGGYAGAPADERERELRKLAAAAAYAAKKGLLVNAGHGLNYDNVQPVARLPGIGELNIGHAIVAQAVFVGLAQAVREMKTLISSAR